MLRKTRLGEKDLIVTCLAESGALLRAVAKGARKPGGSYSSRLELFSIVDLVLAPGRSLDVITSASFSQTGAKRTLGIEQTACASALAELVSALAQENLPNERLYAMAHAAFDALERQAPKQALSLTCAASLKALAYAGFRPSFTTCVECGNAFLGEIQGEAALSIIDGGVVCSSCSRPSDAVSVDAETLRWADALMRSRFDDITSFETALPTLFAIADLIRQWSRIHVGKNLKSIDFLFTCGLF